MKTRTELLDELNTKRANLKTIFDEAGDEMDMDAVTSIEGDSRAKAAEIRRLNDELTDLGTQFTDMEDMRHMKERLEEGMRRDAEPNQPFRHPAEGHSGDPRVEVKDFGAEVAASKAITEYQRGSGVGPVSRLDMDLKTLFQTSAGWAPESTRTGRVVMDEQRPIAVVDIIPQTTTSQAAVVYMEETTFTNAATEIGEGLAYPEGALALTERTSTVRKIATFLPVTDEQMEDVPRIGEYVNNRLTFMLRQRLDLQILTGAGTGVLLTGILNTSSIGSQAKGSDSVPDAVYKGMDLCRTTGFVEPDNAIFHPNDWQSIRLLKTADGVYIWGSPSEPGPARIWGLPVLLTTAETENTAIVGQFRGFCELAVRRGIDIQVTNAHDDYFVKGKLAIRADVRVAFIVYRAAAFAEVTGI